MKKDKPTIIKLKSGSRLAFNRRGIHQVSDDGQLTELAVTPKEMNQIAAYATECRRRPNVEELSSVECGHDVEYNEDGSVAVGCMSATYEEVLLGQKILARITGRKVKAKAKK